MGQSRAPWHWPDCTLSTNRQLYYILAWGSRWQVRLTGDVTLRLDARLLKGQLKFDVNNLAIQNSIDILWVEVDSKLCFHYHLESVVRKAEVEHSPLTWMGSAQSHLSLLDKVQWQAECLIYDASGQSYHYHPWRLQP